jgi:hypothetical protein
LHVPPIARVGRRPEGTSFDSKLVSPKAKGQGRNQKHKKRCTVICRQKIDFFSENGKCDP